MPLKLIPRSPLPPFTYSPSPPSPGPSIHAPADDDDPQSGPSKGFKPPTEFFPERDMHVFGSFPLGGREEAGRAIVRCPKCRRPTMEASYAEHQRICKHILEGVPLVPKRATSGKSLKTGENLKKRRASEDSMDDSPGKRANKHPTDHPVNLLETGPDGAEPWRGQKMKKSEIKRLKKEREREARKEMKEKEKAEIAERKRLRVSGPINLDKQCGVINDKGAPCARSLTCKTHTVGAKRSVPGRTRGYDELYLEWQRANNPRFKEPTKTLPSKKEREAGSGSKGTGGGGGGSGGTGTGGGRKEGRNRPDDEDGGGRLMSEAEIRELVHFAKLAGQRCDHVIGLIGSPGNKVYPSSISGTGGGGHDPHTMAKRRKLYSQTYALPRPTLCHGPWAGHAAFAGVGEALVQALAARPAPAPPPARPAPPILIIKPPGGGEKRVQAQLAAQNDTNGVQRGGESPHAASNQTKSKNSKSSSSAANRPNGNSAAQVNGSVPPSHSTQTNGQGLEQPDYVPHLLSNLGQGQVNGQGINMNMNAQAMIAAAAAAASAVNSNSNSNSLANLANNGGAGNNNANSNNNNTAAMIAMMNNLGAGMQLQLPPHVQMQLQGAGLMPMSMPMSMRMPMPGHGHGQIQMPNGMGGQAGFQQGIQAQGYGQGMPAQG